MSFAPSIARINAACERTFGETCALSGVPIVGIYQAPYAGGLGIAALDPTFRTRTLNIGASPYGQILSVPGVGDFVVRRHEPDGAGWSNLVLEAA